MLICLSQTSDPIYSNTNHRLHFGQMSKAMDEAYDKLVAGEWTKEQATNYLQVHGMNDAFRKKFWRTTQHNMHWENFINKKMSEKDFITLLGKDAFSVLKNKGMLPLDKPSSWDRDQPLALNIDVIMHLLFLGVWSTLVSVGMDWLRMNLMESSFLLYADGLLEKIQSLNLSYCKVLGYKKGKLGGWVSENYLGFARVAAWFYSTFGSTKKDEPYVQPEKEQSKWTRKENLAWLGARGIVKKGKAAELSKAVAGLMAQPGGPPPVVESGGGSNKLFLEAVSGILRVIAVVMQDFMNEELLLEMEYQVKLFLTLFEDLDSKMRKPKAKPKAVTTYNFFSLLNLPVAAGMLGPLRNVWEGGPMGEGYLQQIKAAVQTGLKPGWEMQVMNTVYRNNGLSNVLKSWDKNSGEEVDDAKEIKSSNYHKYKSLATLVGSFERGLPLSCLRFKSGKFGCVVGDSLDVYEILMYLGGKKESVNGMAYITWCIETKEVLGKLKKAKISSAVLLLPLLSETGAPKEGFTGVYTAVTDGWTKLTDGGSFVLY